MALMKPSNQRLNFLKDPTKLNPISLEPILRRGLVVAGLTAIALGLAGLFDAIDLVSFVFLLAIAWICRAIFDIRHPPGTANLAGKERIWLLMSLGFLYLAADELLSIHEGIDRLFHWVFAIRETALTDRIDDLVVLAYAVGGLALLWVHRTELRVLRTSMRYLVVGFILTFLMVAIDALTNRMDFVRHFLFEPQDHPGLVFTALFAEEILKVLAGMCFLVFFYDAWRAVWIGHHTSTEN